MSAYDPTLDPPDDGYRHPDAMPNRSAVLLEAERRLAQEKAQQAIADSRRSTLNRDQWSLGKVGTQEGRELEVLTNGRAVVLTHGGLLGLVCAFEAVDQAAKLADAVDAALAISSTPRAIVGRVGAVGKTLQVERTWTGIVIRDAALEGHQGVLTQVNTLQAAELVETIKRGLPNG